jgi:hypothetical protein
VNAELLEMEILSDQETMEEIRSSGILSADTRFIERRNLTGDAATWITLATSAANLIAAIIKLLTDRPGAKKIRKIRVGAVEIENPTKEDLELLANRLAAAPESNAAR